MPLPTAPDDRDPGPSSVIDQARAASERNDWTAAFEILHRADARGELDAEGLELLSGCARWAGRDDALLAPLERAHREFIAAGDTRAAARTALGLCHAHADLCEDAVAGSWWQRAGELLADVPEAPEHGLHAWFTGRSCGDRGDLDGQESHARRALEIARRVGDRNVEALALLDVAHVSSARGHGDEAMAALERATGLALGGEIGVMESGVVFCNAIWASRSRGEWQRAREWCESANRWVERIRVAYFPGLCRVHRAEILRMRGALPEAEAEAEEAIRLLERGIPRWVSLSFAELGEIRRRRGDFAGAMSAFRRALELGWDPQPGLSRMLLAQGDPESAHRAIERAFHRPPTILCEDHSNLVSARVATAIASGRTEVAADSVAELEAMAERNQTPWDRAAAAQARGELCVATDRVHDAVGHLARARATWAELDAPYELACCCARLADALVTDGDPAGARWELEAACGIFTRIGAEYDRRRVETALAAVNEAPPAEAPPAEASPAAVDGASLCREGEYWSIRFDGAVLRLRDGRGPQYLAELLSRPGEDVFAVDLAAGVRAAPSDPGHAGELIDVEARDAYRERLTELQEELAEADEHHDLARAERLRAERDALAGQLAQAIGLGGRARRAGDPVERARQSVTKAIRAAVKKIAAEHGGLGRYLENTLRTGTTCRFEPDPGQPVRWRVDRTG